MNTIHEVKLGGESHSDYKGGHLVGGGGGEPFRLQGGATWCGYSDFLLLLAQTSEKKKSEKRATDSHKGNASYSHNIRLLLPDWSVYVSHFPCVGKQHASQMDSFMCCGYSRMYSHTR